MAKKPGIPSTSALPAELARLLNPIKENIEMLTGVRGGGIAPLVSTASTAEVIEKINQIIARINSTGA